MEESNVVNATQEPVVEVPEPVADDGATTVQEEPQQEPAKPVQTPEENAKFAEFRRQTESAKAEAEKQKKQSEKLIKALEEYGYKGAPDEIADMLTAQKQNITVEEVQAQRKAHDDEVKRMQDEIRANILESDPEISQQKEELEYYRQKETERVFETDLKQIQAVDPKVKSIYDLGDDFFKLRANGVDNMVAYNAVKASKSAKSAPSIGDIQSQSNDKNNNKFATMSDSDFDEYIRKAERGELRG